MWACLRYAASIDLTDEELAHPLVKRLEDVAGCEPWCHSPYISFANINLSPCRIHEWSHQLHQVRSDLSVVVMSFWHSQTREYLTDTATNNILTLLQRNDRLIPAEAEEKIRKEIKQAEDNYVAAAREFFNDPVLGQNEKIRKLVLNIPYGMGGNVSVFCSPTPSTQIYFFQS